MIYFNTSLYVKTAILYPQASNLFSVATFIIYVGNNIYFVIYYVSIFY